MNIDFSVTSQIIVFLFLTILVHKYTQVQVLIKLVEGLHFKFTLKVQLYLHINLGTYSTTFLWSVDMMFPGMYTYSLVYLHVSHLQYVYNLLNIFYFLQRWFKNLTRTHCCTFYANRICKPKVVVTLELVLLKALLKALSFRQIKQEECIYITELSLLQLEKEMKPSPSCKWKT